MTFCLDTTIITPENNEPIKNAVILLHGYGGDGKDISLLTLNWKRFLKNTVFLCPNGHENGSSGNGRQQEEKYTRIFDAKVWDADGHEGWQHGYGYAQWDVDG